MSVLFLISIYCMRNKVKLMAVAFPRNILYTGIADAINITA